ncbi:MAG: hypothetical protein WC208_10540 [Gallionella sp.]|jgi:hypothetical protein
MKDKDIVNDVLKSESVVKANIKLKRTKADVNINPKANLLEYTKQDLAKLEKLDVSDMTEKEKGLIEQAKKNHRENIALYEKAKLEGVMVPLKYQDLQIIKSGVLEALKYGAEFNWDDDVKMRAMIREENTLTVYLTLRRKDDINQRYYNSLEEIAKEPEATVETLYNIYLENFVLTGEERKNS